MHRCAKERAPAAAHALLLWRLNSAGSAVFIWANALYWFLRGKICACILYVRFIPSGRWVCVRIYGKFWHTISVFDYRCERWCEEIGASFAVHPPPDIGWNIDSGLIYFNSNQLKFDKFRNLISIRKILRSKQFEFSSRSRFFLAFFFDSFDASASSLFYL